jgi:hypothetical protein
MGNRSLQGMLYFTVTHDFSYLMVISKYDGNPAEDEELRAMIESFDFIDRNQPPGGEPQLDSQPTVVPKSTLD